MNDEVALDRMNEAVFVREFDVLFEEPKINPSKENQCIIEIQI